MRLSWMNNCVDIIKDVMNTYILPGAEFNSSEFRVAGGISIFQIECFFL